MCGITGVVAFNKEGATFLNKVKQSCDTLAKRGPDAEGIYHHNQVALGHRRLSIIDTTSAANQPFTDHTGRYTIIFNGEFFNYKEHRQALINAGIPLRTHSDTEVLLYLFIHEGAACLKKVNGFFAFAIYDREEEKMFIARDRIGVKPLLIYEDTDKLLFASEMKAIMAYNIPKEIDFTSLYIYLQLNYIPAPDTILKNVRKLMPGHYLEIQNGNVKDVEYYKIPFDSKETIKPFEEHSYNKQKTHLRELLEESVSRRMVSDVPLGAFLSGGVDSTIIVSIASKLVPNLKTFCIGFNGDKKFDESKDAEAVARLHKTDHTTFHLSNDDLLGSLHDLLDYIDEPFADSSAIAVNILSKYTREYVKVALSGDGADELFAGYNKHRAEWHIRNKSYLNFLKHTEPLLRMLPKSRHSHSGNTIRQLHRFTNGVKLEPKERYWRWCAFVSEQQAENVMLTNPTFPEYLLRYDYFVNNIYDKDRNTGINDILYSDVHLVLPNDMLTKVDMNSMAHGLEVRNPFLDYNVVEYAFKIPSNFKIDKHTSKKILKDAFIDAFPKEILNKKKQGFEVPMLRWIQNDLKALIDDLLNDDFIIQQNIFDPSEIKRLKQKIYSNDPGEVHAKIWGLIVFQYWWRKYIQQ